MPESVDLVVEVKKSLNMSIEADEELDATITQKIQVVQAFMIGAGVKSDKLTSDLAVGIVCIGVNDLWNVNSGEIKFSPVFNMLLAQLA